jgi:hypothetical protein
MGPNELHLDRVRVYVWHQGGPADGH